MCESASISFRPAKGPVSRGWNEICVASRSCTGLTRRAPMLRRLRLCHHGNPKSTHVFTALTCALPEHVYALVRGHPDRAVQPDRLAVEHRVGHDGLNQ